MMPLKPMEEMEDLDATGLVTFRPQPTSSGDDMPVRPPTLRPDPGVPQSVEEMEDLAATGLVTFVPPVPVRPIVTYGTGDPVSTSAQTTNGQDGQSRKGSNKKDQSSGQLAVSQTMEEFPDLAATGLVTLRQIDDTEGDQETYQRIAPALLIPENAIDMEFFLAARHNPLLLEMMILTQQEGIPPALQGNVTDILKLSSEYEPDGEDVAEATEFLEYWIEKQLGRSISEIDLAREAAVIAFDSNGAEESFKKYRAAVEKQYGVTFTVESKDEWKLADIVMAHAALEMAASVFGDRLRDISGIDIDDATAFRWIFGPLTINHSTEVRMEAHAEVFGSLIEVYWKRKEGDDRNYNLYPYVLLHELGHRLNTVAGFGEVWGALSINRHPDYPESRAGMGKSAHRPLHMVIGVDKSHGMYGAADLEATHVEMLQYGEQSDHNEVTADGILNWLVHQITRGASGLENTAEGQKWLDFMDKYMDAWIRHAVTFGIMSSGSPIDLTDDERDMMPFPLPVSRGVLESAAFVRSGPSRAYGNVSGGSPLPRGHDVIVLGRNAKSEDSVYPEWVAVFYRGDINWIFTHDVQGGVGLPPDVFWDDLPVLDNRRKLAYDFSIAAQDDASWFPIMVEAAYGR